MSEVIERLRKYAGLNKDKDRCPSNPQITVREAIEIADYLAAKEAELAECKTWPTMAAVREMIESACLKENEALAVIVEKQREQLTDERDAWNDIRDSAKEKSDEWLEGFATQRVRATFAALSLDTTRAAEILAERDAETLRKAAKVCEEQESSDTDQETCSWNLGVEHCYTMLRRMADEMNGETK